MEKKTPYAEPLKMVQHKQSNKKYLESVRNICKVTEDTMIVNKINYPYLTPEVINCSHQDKHRACDCKCTDILLVIINCKICERR